MSVSPEAVRIIVDRTARAPSPVGRGLEPLTAGIPFPRGLCVDQNAFRLSHASAAVPLQSTVLARWPDQSIKWALLDFQCEPSAADRYLLTWSGGPPAVPHHPVRIATTDSGTHVNTGPASFVIREGGGFPFDRASIDGAGLLTAETVLEDGRRHMHRLVVRRLTVVEQGDVRASVAVEAVASLDGRRILVSARLHFFSDSGTVRVEMTAGNPDRARHRGGFWELGDARSVFVRDVSCVVRHIDGGDVGQILCSTDTGVPGEMFTERVELYQDSSGGPQWAGPNHVNRIGRNPNRFSGYELKTPAGTRSGRRAAPWMVCATSKSWVAVAPQDFWQNAPKALEADHESITLRLWPRQYDDLHELQGGEQKTHVFHVAAGVGAFDADALEWCCTPSIARADSEWYCSSGINPDLTPAADDPHSKYLTLVNSAIEGPSCFEQKRETVDEYGWRHYGDVYADHETAFHSGPGLLVSHYNNQYDVLAGMIFQFMRSGDSRWWRLLQPLAGHVCDVDVYHTTRDKAAYNGGLFWHTIHYEDAGRATHRSYPRSSKSAGGGPSSEHNYATGLMLHYFLTGCARSRETAIGLARWVVDMDDGRLSPFRWLTWSATGLASVTNGAQGPGRGAGNSICALLDGHALTGDRAFLDHAEEIVRRCVHPSDDVEACGLLDRERRWSYVVFLQALGRYLAYKQDLGEIDSMHAYARSSLLAYARWMAAREFPYLDKPEMLEFPNETWAAQDMRKSEVFKCAAAHSTGDERATFLERARFFFDYSTAALSASPHHGRTRPTVLMLLYGYSEALFRSNPPSYRHGAIDVRFPDPVRFVPQRIVAKRRAAIVGAAGAVGLLIGALAWVM